MLYYAYCCIVLQFRGVYPLNIERIADFPAGKILVSSDSLSAQFLRDSKSMFCFQTPFFPTVFFVFLGWLKSNMAATKLSWTKNSLGSHVLCCKLFGWRNGSINQGNCVGASPFEKDPNLMQMMKVILKKSLNGFNKKILPSFTSGPSLGKIPLFWFTPCLFCSKQSVPKPQKHDDMF